MNCDSEVTDGQIRKVRYVCIITLTITSHGLHSEGMGAWEESYSTTGRYLKYIKINILASAMIL